NIICAIRKTVGSAAVAYRASEGPAATDCRFQRTSVGIEGSCGLLFQELPIFTVARVQGVATASGATTRCQSRYGAVP
ncbi:MAG: hypothetical protein ABI969_13050, partial [bacterium]